MDLVYCVGRPANWGHNELRYSLRSAEKYLKFDNVFIVGHKPSFLNDKLIHIPIADDQGHKYKNVAKKVKFILDCKDISEDFIYMNDDFFLMRPYDPVPYLWNDKIKEWVEHYPAYKGKYYQNIKKLYQDFPKGKFFELHFPIVFNKQKAKAVIKKYKLEITLMLRSYYGNEYAEELSPIAESLDYKVSGNSKFKNIEFLPSNPPFISCSDRSAAEITFKKFIQAKFSDRSSFEKINI